MVCGGNTTRQRWGGGGQVQLYRATNDELTEWKHLGPVFEYRDREVINIECPNLFKLDGKWVLIVSPHKPCEYSLDRWT
jgi:beta-fructofuranosidase